MIRYTACHDHDVFVQLTDAEYKAAWDHGLEMRRASKQANLVNKRKLGDFKGVDDDRVQCLGSVTECAVAKALGIEWTAWINTFQTADLHHDIEVRLIGVNHYGLRVYDKDADSRRVVGLVMEKGKERKPYRIPGWIIAKDGKRKEYIQDPHDQGNPFYGVPQQNLRPLSELTAIIHGKVCPADHTSPEWEHAYRIVKAYCQECGDFIGYEPLNPSGDWQPGFIFGKATPEPKRPTTIQHTFGWRNDPID